MIVLDTNVISGLMHPAPDAALVGWIDRQPVDSLWLTSMTVMEVRFGIELLAHGRRRRRFVESFLRLLDETLRGRVLSFDREAADRAAEFAARRRVAGHPIEFRDAEIAGIVAAHNATLATRNIRDFESLAIQIANPWDRP